MKTPVRDTMNRQYAHDAMVRSLMEQIASGRLRAHAPLLSERELCAIHGISNVSVRSGLKKLENEGWIYRVKHVGCFVSERAMPHAADTVAVVRPRWNAEGTEGFHFYHPIEAAMEDVLSEHDLRVIYLPTSRKMAMDFLRAEKNALAVVAIVGHWRIYEAIKDLGLPSVGILDIPAIDMGCRFDAVGTDNFRFAYEAARYLIRHGHQKICHLTVGDANPSAAERVQGCMAAVREAGLVHGCHVVKGDGWSIEHGHAATAGFLAEHSDVTAVFASNDSLALGAMEALQKQGRQVPDDVSVMGFDDWRMADHSRPALTTMRIPREKMGRLAGQLIAERVRHPDREGGVVRLEARLIERDSVAVARDP